MVSGTPISVACGYLVMPTEARLVAGRDWNPRPPGYQPA